jgi:hypothetical protein
VVRALSAVRIDSILLKGPVLGRTLYDRAELRPYADSDLLVAPHDSEAASSALAALGFEPEPADLLPGDPPLYARSWRRDGAIVELHHTLVGAAVSPGKLWAVLVTRTEPMELRGSEIAILDEPARALHVALHAAQHGKAWARPLEDLRRALERIPEESWQRATTLADRLAATEAFAAGLRLRSEGRVLAASLGLSEVASIGVALRASSAPAAAKGLERFTRIPGGRRKAALLIHKLFPAPAFMRAWSPLARRGRLGLCAAYAWRPLWLGGKLASGLRAWAGVRRSAGKSPRA